MRWFRELFKNHLRYFSRGLSWERTLLNDSLSLWTKEAKSRRPRNPIPLISVVGSFVSKPNFVQSKSPSSSPLACVGDSVSSSLMDVSPCSFVSETARCNNPKTLRQSFFFL